MSLRSILPTFDRFDELRPSRLNWVIDTEAVQTQIIDLLARDPRQVFEWLPSLSADADTGRPFDKSWLTEFYQRRPAAVANQVRSANPTGPSMRFDEAFEVSDYGGPFDRSHFDFLPNR